MMSYTIAWFITEVRIGEYTGYNWVIWKIRTKHFYELTLVLKLVVHLSLGLVYAFVSVSIILINCIPFSFPYKLFVAICPFFKVSRNSMFWSFDSERVSSFCSALIPLMLQLTTKNSPKTTLVRIMNPTLSNSAWYATQVLMFRTHAMESLHLNMSFMVCSYVTKTWY